MTDSSNQMKFSGEDETEHVYTFKPTPLTNSWDVSNRIYYLTGEIIRKSTINEINGDNDDLDEYIISLKREISQLESLKVEMERKTD